MFNNTKVKQALSNVRLTKEEPNATIVFADGSSIALSIVYPASIDGDHYYKKVYYYGGIPFGEMFLCWNSSPLGTDKIRVNYQWVEGWCEGGFVPGEAECVHNDDNPVTIMGQATFSPLFIFSETITCRVNFYLNGDIYEF